ncbi:uncharacterized protein V1510DRAFT_363908, partial [Dipodascopsis tothii]|uniref:uncharacterized protein n=1 Tax=Dipodascopsis tothii TaxID=44089 RepID=UPI0034CD22A2
MPLFAFRRRPRSVPARRDDGAPLRRTVSARPPTPEGGRDPILLPNEVVLQVFPKKPCARRTVPPPGGLFSGDEPEFFHSFLTRGATAGALWVTSERLVFVPRDVGTDGYSVPVLELDTLKVVKSSADVWFLLARMGGDMFAAPFSSQRRANAFCRLVANLRFENRVRLTLRAPASDEPEAWAALDAYLPTYRESEDAVERYLVAAGLVRPDDGPADGEDTP